MNPIYMFLLLILGLLVIKGKPASSSTSTNTQNGNTQPNTVPPTEQKQDWEDSVSDITKTVLGIVDSLLNSGDSGGGNSIPKNN